MGGSGGTGVGGGSGGQGARPRRAQVAMRWPLPPSPLPRPFPLLPPPPTLPPSNASYLSAYDEHDALHHLAIDQLERDSARFWRRYAIVDEHWLRRLQRLNDTVGWRDPMDARLSLLELALQTPRFAFDGHGQAYALVRFRNAPFFALFHANPQCYRQVRADEYGYPADALFRKAVRFLYGDHGSTTSLQMRELTRLWTLQAAERNLSPALAAEFHRTAVDALPDDRLVWELWSPGLHPAVERGLQHLHLLAKSAASDYGACLDALTRRGIRCETEEQDDLVRRCRGCIKERLVVDPFDDTGVTIERQSTQWKVRCESVSLTFSDGQPRYEATFHRIRWLAVWAACVAVFGADRVLPRTPTCMIVAFARRDVR